MKEAVIEKSLDILRLPGFIGLRRFYSSAKTLAGKFWLLIISMSVLPASSNARVNSRDILIIKLYTSGTNINDVAKKFNVSNRTVYRSLAKIKKFTGLKDKEQINTYLNSWFRV